MVNKRVRNAKRAARRNRYVCCKCGVKFDGREIAGLIVPYDRSQVTAKVVCFNCIDKEDRNEAH
jgi:hypothetical protein